MGAEGDLEGKALRAIERYGMLSPGDTVVVSVSGGADSVALLLFLNHLARTLSLDLRVFHLDHMLRGSESAGDAEFTERLARELGLDVRLEAVDVDEVTREWDRSPEDAARVVRLERLFDFAQEAEADRVAVGHTADDQVETFLMRVVQGAGLTGLGGISPVSGIVVRPFIEVWRWEVEEYCSRRNVVGRLDSSNLDERYLRNKVRLSLIPFLVGEFGPGVKEVILREVESLGVDREFVGRRVEEAFDRTAVVEDGEVHIDLQALLELPDSLGRGVVREAWARLMPRMSNLSWRHVANILEKVAGGASGARLDLPRSVVAEREYGRVILRMSGDEEKGGEDAVVSVPVPGAARLPGTGMTLEASLVEAGDVDLGAGPACEFVRPDLALPLEVRPPRPGDRFHPLGSPGSRKVADFFIDIKLPRRVRRRCRLVLSGGEVVWVAGHRLDERFRLRPADRRAVRLLLRRDDEYDVAGARSRQGGEVG